MSHRTTISPIDFGIFSAKNGVEAYNVLLKTHTFAKTHNLSVDYRGIKEIKIEIPPNAKSIPLTYYTDFSETKIIAINKYKDLFLFSLNDEMQDVDISPNLIDEGNLTNTPLRKGFFLLVVEDNNPWITERAGYGNPFYRRDIIFVKDGLAKNSTIFQYNNHQSNAKCKWIKVDKKKKIVKGVVFNRDAQSVYKTFLLKVSGQYNVLIENIKITTPPNDSLYGDACIQIHDSYKIKLKNIKIDGTYSLLKKYGYGINLNNVSDFEVNNLTSVANWGIFGNNNVSNVKICNSELNRFDIHCYGKNIICDNCIFYDLYNQYSSVVGYVKYSHCTFDNCTPVLLEPSYNAYTPFDIYFEDCVLRVTKEKNYFTYARKMVREDNSRPELNDIYWPSLYLKNIQIVGNDDVNVIFLYNNDFSAYNKPLKGNLNINLDGLEFSSTNTGRNCELVISSQSIDFNNKITINTYNISNKIFIKTEIKP